MATVAVNVPHQKSEQIVAAVREERKAYTFKIAVSMALYACLFFVLAFCGPYVLPAITLLSDAPLTDRQVAASQLLLLSETVWVALPVFFLGAALFSMVVTRRVVDALERLGQSARAWASGKVSHRLRFREADRLTDLAQLLNQGWSQVGQGVETMRQESLRARAAVDGAIKLTAAQGAGGTEALRQLQITTEALDRIQVHWADLRRVYLTNPGDDDEVSAPTSAEPWRIHLDRIDDRGGHSWGAHLSGHSLVQPLCAQGKGR